MIVAIFAGGFQNISLAIEDYYKYDKITNIERVALENLTFPAVTLCHYGSYKRDHYLNNTFVKTAEVLIRTDNVSRIKNFINETYFYSKDTNKNLNVREHTDYFKIPEMYDCVRFNGVVTNKSIELFKANTTLDLYHILLKNSYQEYISMNEYYRYHLQKKGGF